MVRFAGKALDVYVENSGGTEVTLTYVTGATVTYEYEENTTTGDDVKAALAGQLISEVVVDYEYDTTATTGNQAVLEGIDGNNTTPKFVRVRPLGTGSLLAQFSIDALLLDYGPVGVNREGTIVGQAVFKNHDAASVTPGWGSQAA